MTRKFDLEQESRKFGDHLTHVLNGTICTGVPLTSVVSTYSRSRTVVGYGITKDNQDEIKGIPVTVGRRPAQLYLGPSIHLGPDDANEYLMVTKSVMILAIGEDVGDDSNVLLHYDYEREKEDDYPEAHLEVCASSNAWEIAGHRLDGSERLLERLHLPVGGRRYRPTLEDLIEFLVRENLAETHPNCDALLEASRTGFHEKQLRAAVRRNPQPAVDQLRKDGYTVTGPAQ